MKHSLPGIVWSLLFHGLCIIAMVVGGVYSETSSVPFNDPPPCSIPLEIVEVSEISQAPISKPVLEEPASQELKREENTPIVDPTPMPELKPEIKPEPEPKPEPVLTPKPVPTPPIPETKPDVKPDVTPDAALEEDVDVDAFLKEALQKPIPPAVKALTKEAPKKIPTKKPPPKAKKPVKPTKPPGRKGKKNTANDEEDFIKALKNLDDGKKGPSAATPQTDPNSSSRYGAASIGPHMSLSHMDRVRRLLEDAWVVPLRAHETGRGKLVVVVQLDMNRDGTIQRVTVLDGEGTPSHPAYAMGVQNARQALAQPQCNPLPLPPESYAEWKTFKFRFTPQ